MQKKRGLKVKRGKKISFFKKKKKKKKKIAPAEIRTHDLPRDKPTP